jgi:hypothetical protein
MKISEIELGFTFTHPEKGECTVVEKKPRTIMIRHKFGTTKNVYRKKDETFLTSDF